MLDPTYPFFSIAAFLGFVLVLVPLPWHFQAWNSGTCFYMMWSALACLNQFINSVVWADDVLNKAPVWCDISIRILMASTVGIPAASLCINRRLYKIARVQTVSITPAEKRRAILVDTLICVLMPLVFLALQYIVQGHRFNIYEEVGCYPAIYNSLPTYFINLAWPPLIGCISACYGVLSLRAFFRRRAAFAQFLAPSGSSATPGLTTSRYLRLMALAATDILLTTPLGIFVIYSNITLSPIQPWRSLADTHFMFSRVVQIPAVLWRGQPSVARGLDFTRWSAVATALVFFAFFGFAAEARKNYALAWRALITAFWRFAARLGIRRPQRGFFSSITSAPFQSISPLDKPSSKPRATPLDISLPVYSFDGTGALTSPTSSASHFTDLKRAASFASSTAATATSSRFIEHLPRAYVYDLEKGVQTDPQPEEDQSVELHPQEVELAVDTPSSMTSFTPSSPSPCPTSPNFALPLHLGWASCPYPAVYAETQAASQAGHVASTEHESDLTWSPTSDAHSIPMQQMPAAAAASSPSGSGRTLV